MQPITDDQVVKLLPALAEAARADKNTAARFVPPRTGILEETASRRHQFVFGRRGVGKSTLLRKIESTPGEHGDVIFVDIETLRQRPYPDVLIELLIELLDALSANEDRPFGWQDQKEWGAYGGWMLSNGVLESEPSPLSLTNEFLPGVGLDQDEGPAS